MAAAKLISAFLILGGSVRAPALAAPGTIVDLMRGGDIVVDQQPTQTWGPPSDTAFLDRWGDPVWQRFADNILLAQPAAIRRVSWWGFYGGDPLPITPPPDTETMRIRFYAARPSDGLPGETLLEESFLNPSRTPTGRTIAIGGRPLEYIYQTSLSQPVTLQANVLYWLEIAQIGDDDTAFRWEQGFGLQSGYAFINLYVPDWEFTLGSLAFQLSTVPEPAPVVAIVLFVAVVFGRKRRRLIRVHFRET